MSEELRYWIAAVDFGLIALTMVCCAFELGKIAERGKP